jgi:uncharacterized protein YacL
MDLAYHFIAGALVALIIVWVTRVKPLWMLNDKTVIIAGLSGLVAGLFKEVIVDWFIRQSQMEFADIVLTFFGSIMLVLFLKFIHAIKTEIMADKVKIKTIWKIFRWVRKVFQRPVDPPPPPPPPTKPKK